MNDKLKLIDKLLREIVWETHSMSDGKDEDYKNLDEVISYLDATLAVINEKAWRNHNKKVK
jgi:hypothetical protein